MIYDGLFRELGIGRAQMCVANSESIAYFLYVVHCRAVLQSLSKVNHNDRINHIEAKAANLPPLLQQTRPAEEIVPSQATYVQDYPRHPTLDRVDQPQS